MPNKFQPTTHDTGCRYHKPTCVTCPFKMCVLEDMSPEERAQYLVSKGYLPGWLAVTELVPIATIEHYLKGGAS